MHFGKDVEQGLEHHTPSCTIRREQCDKTSPVKEDGQGKALLYQHFVLSGMWPRLGGGQGVTLGKLAVKGTIKKYGRSVTLEFLRLTNALVIGEIPGPKKILDAHGCNLAIIELNHLNDIFHRRVSGLSNFCMGDSHPGKE